MLWEKEYLICYSIGFFETVKRTLHIWVTPEIEFILRPIVSPESLLLTSVLPSCIMLPTSAVSMVALFREAQLDARNTFPAYSDRMLPQTGHCGATLDIVLSSFPKLLADTAACRVLMYFWSREASHPILDMKAVTQTPSTKLSSTQQGMFTYDLKNDLDLTKNVRYCSYARTTSASTAPKVEIY